MSDDLRMIHQDPPPLCGRGPAVRIAVLGDDRIGPLSVSSREQGGLSLSFREDSFIVWLRALAPSILSPDELVIAVPGAAAARLAQRVNDVVSREERPDAVLICAGLEDCAAAIRGVAPDFSETAHALERMADFFLLNHVKPIFVIPPPSPLFANGLFAERYIALIATLRRISACISGVALIDPIPALLKPQAYGLEPDDRYATKDGLTSVGAFRLARAVLQSLRELYPTHRVDDRAPDRDCAVLNDNPELRMPERAATAGIAGPQPTAYAIDGVGTGGVAARATPFVSPGSVGVRIALSGGYATSWGAIRLYQRAPDSATRQLRCGDLVGAFCDLACPGEAKNISSVSLHATLVRAHDFVGLHSAPCPVAEAGSLLRLSTPVFAAPDDIQALHVSLHILLSPGVDRDAAGEILVQRMVLYGRRMGAEAGRDQDMSPFARRAA